MHTNCFPTRLAKILLHLSKQKLSGSRKIGVGCFRTVRAGILISLLAGMVSATAQVGGQTAIAAHEPSRGALTNTLVQIAALQAEAAAHTPAQKKIHPALWEALREDRGLPPQSDALRARSHLIPRPGGRLLVNIKAAVTDSVLTNIQQSGGLIVNAFPQSQTIRAEVPVAALETIANLSGVVGIEPAFFADSAESATNAVRSAFGPVFNGIKPRVQQPDSTNTNHAQ